jgi:site-specific recombinase XerD
MKEAYKDYLKHRLTPRFPEHNDYLIIIDQGSNYGLPIITGRSDFIWRQTKKIAVNAGFTRSVYPYLIKPSAITDGFNQQMNPKILQRQARHKNIETTLRYDHSTDEMVKDYFNRKQEKINNEFRFRGDEVGYS